MKAKLFFSMLTIVSILLAAPALQAQAQQPDDRAAILDVVKQFETAIQTKDSIKLKSLFFDKNIIWISVAHPESYSFVKQYDPKIKQIEQRGAYELLSDPQLKNVALAEVFLNPVIHSDGQVATATFDYAFKMNGQFTNWGKEGWHLVKENGNWKILHLVYSYNFVQVKPVPDLFKGH